MVQELQNPSKLRKFYIEITKKSSLSLFFVLFLTLGFLVTYKEFLTHQDLHQHAGGGAMNTGTNWNNVTGNLANMPSECGNLTIVSSVPSSSAVIAGVSLKGLWSNSGGSTWTQLGTGAGSAVITNRPSWISYDPSGASTFWESGIYNGGGAYKTTNNGNTFQQLGSVAHNDYISVDFSDPNRQLLLAGGHEQGQTVYKSTNGGGTWTNIGVNLPAGTGFSSDPVIIDSQTYIVNTYPSWGGGTPGIYRTTNGGTTWTKVSSEPANQSPLITSDGTVYYSDGNGLVKSSDNGATWAKTGSGLLSEFRPIQLPNGNLVSSDNSDLLLSSDGGATWIPFGPSVPFTPQSLTYSTGQSALFISHWDCGGVVLPNAIASLSLSLGSIPTVTSIPTVIPPTPTSATTADINHDGKVDVQDLSYMLSHWNTNDSLADFNHSGKVDILDLSILLANWKP